MTLLSLLLLFIIIPELLTILYSMILRIAAIMDGYHGNQNFIFFMFWK